MGEVLVQNYIANGIVTFGEYHRYWSDRTGYLMRIIDVPKLTENRRRGRDIHLASITVDPGMSVYGERVLLLDDVTTTGNSLYACREILISAGAKSVEMFAIGQAVYD